MLTYSRVLLASHGTVGARAAELAALELCRADATLFHLIVVPDLWRGMMGDDWLNNASTRDAYGKYVEGQLGREIAQHQQAFERDARKRGIRHESRVAIGKPEQCLIDYASEVAPELVVIGSPRPPQMDGLRSRMQLEKLVKGLDVPLLIVPHPK